MKNNLSKNNLNWKLTTTGWQICNGVDSEKYPTIITVAKVMSQTS